MEEIGGGPVGSPGLVDRVKAILLKPEEEWTKIDVEPATVADLYRSYVVPLAAIGPACGLIRALVFGYGSFLGITFRPSVMTVVSSAIVQYVLTLVMVFVLALIIDALAPTFKAAPNRVQALKLVVYSMTAGWVGGVFAIVPSFALLGLTALIAGLYSLYLFYLGLPKLMKVPQDSVVGYIAVIVIAAIISGYVVQKVASMVTYSSMGVVSGPLASDGEVSGTVSVPGLGSIDLAKAQAAGKQMEAAAKAMEANAKGSPNAAVQAANPDMLQGVLPASLAGSPKADTSSASGGAAGFGASHAEASYGSGATMIKLSVTDMGVAGAFAGAMGGALNIQSSSKNEHGYETVSTVDGRMTTEKWNKDSSTGTYSVIVGNRFMVSADGGGTIDSLKSAVSQVNFGALEQLAKS
jgi:hypothetical protein